MYTPEGSGGGSGVKAKTTRVSGTGAGYSYPAVSNRWSQSTRRSASGGAEVGYGPGPFDPYAGPVNKVVNTGNVFTPGPNSHRQPLNWSRGVQKPPTSGGAYDPGVFDPEPADYVQRRTTTATVKLDEPQPDGLYDGEHFL